MLGVADKVVNPVFGPLVANPAAEGKDIVQIIARLQERRDVGDTVSRIATGGVDRFVVQPAGRQRLLQIEEHLVGIEGLMIGVETPGEIPSRQRLAVEGQLCPVLIGILLRRGEAADLTFAERREWIEGEGLIAIVHLAHQILAEEIGIGVLEADQMALGAGDTIGIEPIGGVRFAAAGDRGHIFPEPQTIVIIALAFIVLGDQLQLAVVVDLDRPRPHDVQTIRVLEPRLGVIEDQRIVIAVVPTAETLIGYR